MNGKGIDRGPLSGAEVQLLRMVQNIQSAVTREQVFKQVQRTPDLLVALDSMIERGLMKVATRKLSTYLTPKDFKPNPVTGIYFVPGVLRQQSASRSTCTQCLDHAATNDQRAPEVCSDCVPPRGAA